MAEVKVLIKGVHKMIDETSLMISGSTTLIKSDKNIIVDPGSFINRDKLIVALSNEGLKPENVDAVILTHTHIDHTANLPIFFKAKIFSRLISGNYSGQYQLMEKGTAYRFNILEEPIANDVRIIETPGHSIDSITVLVATNDGLVAIAGDAIASEEYANLEKKPSRDLIFSMDKYEESRKTILKIADWVVPGHGEMFKLKK